MERRVGLGRVDGVAREFDDARDSSLIWQTSIRSSHVEYSAVRMTGRRVAWMAGDGSKRVSRTEVCIWSEQVWKCSISGRIVTVILKLGGDVGSLI